MGVLAVIILIGADGILLIIVLVRVRSLGRYTMMGMPGSTARVVRLEGGEHFVNLKNRMENCTFVLLEK